jgi:hypothetical protein
MSTSTAVDYPAQMIAAFRARESHALKVLWKIRVSDRRPDGEPWRAIDVDRISDWGQKEFVFPPGTTLLPEVVAASATDPTVIEVSASLVP